MDVGKRIRKFDKQAETYEKKRMKQEFGPLRRRLLHSLGCELNVFLLLSKYFPKARMLNTFR